MNLYNILFYNNSNNQTKQRFLNELDIFSSDPSINATFRNIQR